jgi:hypothetical protein
LRWGSFDCDVPYFAFTRPIRLVWRRLYGTRRQCFGFAAGVVAIFAKGTELDEVVASPLIVATNHATGVRELSICMEKLMGHGGA